MYYSLCKRALLVLHELASVKILVLGALKVPVLPTTFEVIRPAVELEGLFIQEISLSVQEENLIREKENSDQRECVKRVIDDRLRTCSVLGFVFILHEQILA